MPMARFSSTLQNPTVEAAQARVAQPFFARPMPAFYRLMMPIGGSGVRGYAKTDHLS